MSELHAETLSIEQAYDLAVRLAKKGVGFVSPNPPVGCVILNKSGCLIGSGYHEKYGGPHAEVNAINSVQDQSQLEGAMVIVTLEPCAHQGKTPPCCELLSKYKIKKVFYAVDDPNPLVSGKGLQHLQSFGVVIEKLPMNAELNEIMRPFLYSMNNKKPFVTVKIATSLDGQMALKSGESQWITGEESRQRVHELRGEQDAVLIGSGTFLADNPSLNSRVEAYNKKTNKVIIIDPHAQTLKKLASSKLFSVRSAEDIFVAVYKKNICDKFDFNVISIPNDSSKTAFIDYTLDFVFKKNVSSILVEGGASVFSSFISTHSAQRILLFVAPTIIGSVKGLPWSKNISIQDLSDQYKSQIHTVDRYGSDLCLDISL